MPRIINTSKPMPSDVLGRLAFYSGMDNLTLSEINAGLEPLLDEIQRKTYLFEMELQAALFEMSWNGILVDQGRRDKLTREIEQKLQRTQGVLHALCAAIGYYRYYLDVAVIRFKYKTGIEETESFRLPRSWDEWKVLPIQLRRQLKQLNPGALAEYHKALKEFGPPYLPGHKKKNGAFNGNSPGQKLRLFYDFLGHSENTISQELCPDFYPPWNKTRGISEIRTRNQKNEWTPSTDRESLEKIQFRGLDNDPRDAYYWALPFVNCCLQIADYAKTLGFLRCRLERGYFKASFGAVTDTGRLNSQENAQGYGSNAQNITPDLRIILCAEPGWKLAAPDYEQIESRNVGAICYRLFGATRYLDATECGDLHTLVCSLVWTDLAWPEEFTLDYLAKYGPPFPKELIKAAKTLAKKKFYRHFSRRDMVKRLGHGSNYRGQPPHMAKQTHIELALVRSFQEIYFGQFPELTQWHRWVVEQLQTKGEITTLMGRRRRFFGRPNDDATIRKAIAYEPQSIAADYTNTALLRIYHAQKSGLPIKLFLQKHDEIGFRYLEKDEDLTVPQVCSIMEHSIPIVSPSGQTRNWKIPVEPSVGWNLGHRVDYDEDGQKLPKPINPDGLIEYQGHDDRKRTEYPNDLFRRRL